MAAKKKAAKKPAKKAAKKAVKKAAKKATKRKPNAAFMKPVTPNEKLAAVVGAAPLPRTELTKKLWAYIKKNNLQDKKNRRMINADDKLKVVFGGKGQVSMFDMTKLVSKNLK
jgi:chromatin remodeling complex protein RSC6